MERPNAALLDKPLSDSLDDNLSRIRALLHADVNADAKFRGFASGNRAMCAVYIEGMADDRNISEYILRACLEGDAPSPAGGAREAVSRVLEIAECELSSDTRALIQAVVSGKTALLIEGCAEAVLMETRGYPARAVNQTTNESVVIGAQEGFVESLRTNMTLMRRYVPSEQLITEPVAVGRRVPCQACLVYLEGVADPGVVDEARRRLQGIDQSAVQGLGAIQQLIEDRPFALLPQFLQTERPDRAASCVLSGQIVILADNSPYALAAPVTLFHQIHTSDDSFARWQYGTFLRLVRVGGILLSVLLPGLYIALTNHHTHLIPMSLLGAIAESRANVPFSVLTEVLLMEFSFCLINEAGTRMPRQIGSALGIVGALIMGQAAVSASIISPMLIIIVALTGLGNYAVPNYGFSLGLILYRLFVIMAGAVLGLYGVGIAGFCLATGLCGLRSMGVPFLSPVAPQRPHNPDLLLRLPLWLQQGTLFFAKKRNWMQ